MDMSRSFGKIKQQLMIINPFTVGISSTALSWFVSYLSVRKQHGVLKNGDSSLYKPCESGVPQARVLRPLLFSIYVYNDDVDEVTNPCHTRLFADDILTDVSSNTVNALIRPLFMSVKILAHYLKQKAIILYHRSTQVTGFHSSRRTPLHVCYASKATASAYGG